MSIRREREAEKKRESEEVEKKIEERKEKMALTEFENIY